ncbi:O-antigen ligase family protein [uncultured Maribacter sp.]|uniref:O-antigen ligase family protein n=1 Tax=uncultured Maribacter sp. TaxID=431308 RepID=UPI00262A9269|nr:O-antigen ligase family protein [uncultured Maribacter sp.]
MLRVIVKKIDFNLLKRIELVAISILIITLPQVNIKSFFNSTVTSKFIYFSYFLLALLIPFILHFLRLKKIKLSKLDGFLVSFILYITVNRYIIQGDYSFSIRYLELLGLSLLYCILRSIKPHNFYWLFLAIVISGTIQAIYGNLQLLGYFASNHSGFNITGSFFNPGPYGGFLVCVWILALGMYLFKENIIHKIKGEFDNKSKYYINTVTYLFNYIPLVGLATTLLVIPATQSRAAWVALLLGSLFLLIIKHKIKSGIFKPQTKIRKAISILLVFSILASMFYGAYHFKKNSADGRLLVWKVSANIVADYPVFGVGFDRFMAHYMNYQASYFLNDLASNEVELAGNTRYAFNEFIQLIVENGLVGGVLLLLLIYGIVTIKIMSSNKEISYIIKSVLIGIGIFASFSYPMQILPVKCILVLLLALIANIDVQKKAIGLFMKKRIQIVYKISFLTCGVFLLFFGITTLKKFTIGFKTWKEASYSFNNELYNTSVKEYESVLTIFHNNGVFLEQYGQALGFNGQHEKALLFLALAEKHVNSNVQQTTLGDNFKRLTKYKDAEMAYVKASKMIPNLLYPNYLLAKLYNESGQKEKAIKMANKVLKMPVKIHSNAVTEINNEMKMIINKNNGKPKF